MSTEQLIIELDARTAKIDAKLKKVEKSLDGVEGSTKKADSGFKSFTKGAKAAGGVALKLATAAAALSAAITAMVVASANGRRELELLSKQAKTSTSDFQALSFATSRYGINAEQIADISKDIADKIGEFSAAGTGVFQDYADVMKLTKEQAKAAALEFEGLSSQEILGTMVSRMEAASVSGDKMTFVLESMGNDASKLLPLFSNNSKELLLLKQRFDDVNKSLQITEHQADALREVSTTFTLMTSSIGNATTAISATLAPVMDDFFNDVIEIVPEATQTIIDFINSFLDAENITSSIGAKNQIEKQKEMIAELEKRIEKEEDIAKKQMSQNQFSGIALVTGRASLQVEKQRLAELQAQLDKLVEIEALDDAKKRKGGEIGGEKGGSILSVGTGDDLEALRQFTLTRAELLDEEFEKDWQRLIDAGELLGLEETEQYDRRLELIKDFAAKKTALEKSSEKTTKKVKKGEVEWADKTEKEKLNAAQDGVRQGMALNQLLFDDNKAIGAGLIVADTAIAISKANALGYPMSIPAMALAAATGVAQLAALQGSSKGGGSISSSGGSLSPPQDNYIPDQSEIGLDFRDESGSTSNIITFNTDSGDQLLDVLSGMLNESQRQGRG